VGVWKKGEGRLGDWRPLTRQPVVFCCLLCVVFVVGFVGGFGTLKTMKGVSLLRNPFAARRPLSKNICIQKQRGQHPPEWQEK